jgi:hypothetical protein
MEVQFPQGQWDLRIEAAPPIPTTPQGNRRKLMGGDGSDEFSLVQMLKE